MWETTAPSQDEIRNTIGHFVRNRERMGYQPFREQGPCVSSGAVKIDCKNVIGTRLKRDGMYWSRNGANRMALLRSFIIINRLDDY